MMILPERKIWPRPPIAVGTPLEIVWDWDLAHYCQDCFYTLCEYCTGRRGDGICHCWHGDDWSGVE